MEAFLNTNELDPVMPWFYCVPVVGILGCFSIPNRPAYRSNPDKMKELQMQVCELLEKGVC
jgi:hypothetical protein